MGPLACLRMSFCIGWRGDRHRPRPCCLSVHRAGQASVEAAFLLPTLMLLLALLTEPACMGYTLAVMRASAAETVRVVATDYDGDVADCVAFAKRRLRAIPEVPIFHVGGEDDWEVLIARDEQSVRVSIRGHVRPLPLMGVLASTLGSSDGRGVILEAGFFEKTRADWVGGSYDTWQEMWG